MKMSKLLQMLMFGMFMKFGVTGEEGGGSDDEAAKKKAEEAEAAKKKAEEDEAAKKKAEEDKGKPSDAEAKLLKENMKKKEQIEGLSKQLTDAQAMLKQLEELGGLDTIKSLVSERKTAEERQLEEKGDYERLKQRMAEEHGKEVTTLKAQIDEITQKLASATGTINELTIGTQFGQSKFISEELTLTPGKTRVIYGDYFDLEDGKIVGYDKPRSAKGRTPIVDQYGNAMPFDEALRKIVESDPEKDHLLKSKVKSGASSDTKKLDGKPTKEQNDDPLAKIGAGLKGLGKLTN